MKLKSYGLYLILYVLLQLGATEKLNEIINNSTVFNEIEKNVDRYAEIETTFQLLEEGEQYLNLGDHRDVVLVLGNTGSGKSTFTQFVVGDNTKMRALEVSPGTGEFIIIDESNKIGHGIFSKTIFPDKVVDTVTNIAYYDCPGFSDTRNAAFDIASTYFIKKTIDHAKSVKIVLTISYSSVRIGVDRTDFMKLVKHLNEFIKDIHKFKDSIVLVITKVDNEYVKQGKDFNLVSDEKLINKIAKFIANVKQSVEERLDSSTKETDQLFYQKALNLIDIFLTKQGQTYRNIVIFRRPDEPGLISDIKLLQNGKSSIKKIVETLVFTKKSNNDFGYSVSDNSKHSIFKLTDKINGEVSVDISNTTNDIKQHLRDKMKDFRDLHVLKEDLDSFHKFLMENHLDLENTPDFKYFFIKYMRFIDEMNLKSSRRVFLSILKKYKYILFLQLVSGEKLKTEPLEWVHALQPAIELSQESKIWYSFLTDLYQKVSDYGLYSKLCKQHMKINNEKSLRIKRSTDTEVTEILTILKDHNIKDYDSIEHMTMDSNKIQDLYNVVNVTYHNNMTIVCPQPDTLIVRGDYIKFSKIGAIHPCSDQIKNIKIFALNTVFIDADVIRVGEELNMFIASPKWEIIGKRRIILDGYSVKQKPSKASLGQDGRPGLPGGPGGNFLGVGKKIINGEQLTISTNGGDGGAGQSGGDGHSGLNSYTHYPYGNQEEGERIMQNSGGFWRTGYNYRNVAQSAWEGLGYIIGIYHQIETYSYRAYGKPGERGGDGGLGGEGGIGGHPGKIAIYGFRNSGNIFTANKKGSNGNPGIGGRGGQGGRNGDELYLYLEIKKMYWFGGRLKSTNLGWHVTNRVNKGFANNGAQNLNLFSKLGLKTSKNNDRVIETPHNIIDYKMYLLENLKDKVKRRTILEFYSSLSNDLNIQNTYDSFSFLHELKQFENNLHSHINEKELDNFYLSLLNRIKDYAEKTNSFEENIDQKKMLNYLYALTLSKIVNQRQNVSESSLIIDIDGYFKLIMNDFIKLKHYTNEIVKNEYNKKYKEAVNIKIKEANQLIQTQIIPSVNEVSLSMEKNIDKLILEVINMQNESHEQKIQLSLKRNELIKSIEKRGIFESLKLISIIANFFGPIGETIGDIIQITDKVSRSLALNDYTEKKERMLPDGVKILVTDGIKLLDNFVEMKSDALKHLLDSLIVQINKHPTELSDLSKKATDLKEDLVNKDENKNLDMPKIISISEQLLSALSNTYEQFKDRNSTEIVDTLTSDLDLGDDISSMLEYFINTAQLAELFTQTYIQHRDDERKLQELNKAILQHDVNLKILRDYQSRVYSTIYPMLTKLRQHISEYETSLKSKSLASLDITGWDIQSYLKEIKIILSQILKGFDVGDDMVRLVEKMDESMTTMITVYDRIQVYNEQKEFADYIADLNSVSPTDVKTSNKTINVALVELDLALKSNIVLAQYQKALNNFKQFIFPFAHYYLEEYQLPPEIHLEKNIENVISNASRQIENLKSKINEHKLILNKNVDEYVYEEYFKSGENSNEPFIIWDNIKYETTISKLLSGEEVILKANILNSNQEKNAIKFNSIHLNFKTTSALAKELDEKLKLYDVSMKHFGNSYFRCDNIFYLLTSDSQTFYYSFEKNSQGEPVRQNRVYKKIQNGQYILSPYATWSFQLKNPAKGGFNHLHKFKGQIDLELSGKGQYVSAENHVCNTNLKQYYHVADTISVTDIIEIVDAL